MLILLSVFFLAFVVPYLWILPIHYISGLLNKKNNQISASPFRWGLRHFWIISIIMIFSFILVVLFYQYDNLFLGVEETNPINQDLADMSILSMFGLALSCIFFIKKQDLELFWGKIWSKKDSILKGIGYAFILKIGLFIYARIFNISFDYNPGSYILSINDEIISLINFYPPLLGFFLIVIPVPVYEEIIFRGIILSGCEKRLKFIFANSIQALLFALLHQSLELLPYFFAFGMLAGHLRNTSQSLAPGISMHVTNNFFAFIAILIMNR
ncbi:MAG: CPBP family intramembrane metalloprotease [Bacteroidetes bacterium]|nr:CPBP family intramembrane metalloprotease [Bacteroidota bacterium]